MKYAAQTEDGLFTGALYDHVTPAITSHHASYHERLVPVSDLVESDDGGWTAIDPFAAEIAAELEVSRFQARAALLQIGKLAAVDAVVAESGDPLTQLAWAEAVSWRRTSPTIAALATHPLINLSSDELDNLFIAAAAIGV